jgi:hypothetical protein
MTFFNRRQPNFFKGSQPRVQEETSTSSDAEAQKGSRLITSLIARMHTSWLHGERQALALRQRGTELAGRPWKIGANAFISSTNCSMVVVHEPDGHGRRVLQHLHDQHLLHLSTSEAPADHRTVCADQWRSKMAHSRREEGDGMHIVRGRD